MTPSRKKSSLAEKFVSRVTR